VRAEIVSIGTEILLGETVDTDSAYLASELPSLGIELVWVSQVGDDRARLGEVLKRAWGRSELILTTGGLGPTEDDLTRETIAEVLGEELTVDPELEKWMRERFARFGLNMPLSNLRQAVVIPSAQSIPNTRGSAPGWWVEKDGSILVALPGPPGELQEMWQREIEPELRKRSSGVLLTRTIKTFGLPEAATGEAVSSLFSSDNPSLGVYAKVDGIHLRLTARADDQDGAEKLIGQGETAIRAALDKYIWGVDDDTLEGIVAQLLNQKRLSLAIMEDYSAGRLAAIIADVPDSSDFFKGGLVTQTDGAKVAFGVNPELLSQHGAVSEEAAMGMAEAARNLLKADIGVSITGMKRTEERPTGFVYIGIANGRKSTLLSRFVARQRAATAALFELRKSLLVEQA
jgi:nicotinamide-nucleotide amidase